MSANRSIEDVNKSTSVRSGRRRLIHSLAMAAVVLLAAGQINLRAQENPRIIMPAPMPPDTSASPTTIIPTPQYVPAGYALWRVYREPADGFKTGKTEIEFEYQDPKDRAKGILCPLQIFVSPITQKHFSGTSGQTPELLTFWVGSKPVEAAYFEGTQTGLTPEATAPSNSPSAQAEASDVNTDSNSLVFPFEGFMIGIRGNSQSGLGRAELIKVARSLTYATR